MVIFVEREASQAIKRDHADHNGPGRLREQALRKQQEIAQRVKQALQRLTVFAGEASEDTVDTATHGAQAAPSPAREIHSAKTYGSLLWK